MEIALKPELEQVVHDLVQSGRFASSADVVAAALSLLVLEAAEPLDHATLAKLDSGIAQLERGEYVEYDVADLDQLPADIERRARERMNGGRVEPGP